MPALLCSIVDLRNNPYVKNEAYKYGFFFYVPHRTNHLLHKKRGEMGSLEKEGIIINSYKKTGLTRFFFNNETS